MLTMGSARVQLGWLASRPTRRACYAFPLLPAPGLRFSWPVPLLSRSLACAARASGAATGSTWGSWPIRNAGMEYGASCPVSHSREKIAKLSVFFKTPQANVPKLSRFLRGPWCTGCVCRAAPRRQRLRAVDLIVRLDRQPWRATHAVPAQTVRNPCFCSEDCLPHGSNHVGSKRNAFRTP